MPNGNYHQNMCIYIYNGLEVYIHVAGYNDMPKGKVVA